MVRPVAESRPEPSAAGTLAKRPTQHLLVYARDRALSGTLEIDDGRGDGGIVVLAGGRIVKARVDRASSYLGAVAYELGLVNAAALDASLRELAQGKRRHGEILVAGGALTQPQLSVALTEQTLRKLTYLHGVAGASKFAFYEGYDALTEWPADGPRVDPLPAVWRGVRDFVTREQLDAMLARLEGGTWRLPSAAIIVNFCFDQDTIELAGKLRAPTSAAEFIAQAGGARHVAERLLYVLTMTRQIEVVDQPQPMPTPPPSQRTLGAALTSGTYQRTISFELRTPFARPEGAPASSPKPLPDVALPTRAEIALRASTIGHESFYDVLGVERAASAEEIRSAYFRLSRAWRPERLPPDLEDVRELCAIVRARMDEAYRTLNEPEERGRYDLIGGQRSRPSARVDAETVYRQAELAVSRRDIAQATDLARRAHDLAPQEGRYGALLVWLESCAPEVQSAAEVTELIGRLDRIVRDDRDCEKAFYYRAMLHRRLGDEDAAARDFARVAAMDPRNIEAVREVRLHQMRRKKR